MIDVEYMIILDYRYPNGFMVFDYKTLKRVDNPPSHLIELIKVKYKKELGL